MIGATPVPCGMGGGARMPYALAPCASRTVTMGPPNRPPHGTPDTSLELDGDAFRALVSEAAQRIAPYLDSLPEQPSWDLDGAEELARSVRRPMPESGAPAAEVLDELFERYVTKGYNTAGPGYLAYIPGGGVPSAAVADLIADAVNRYVGVWTAAPALAQIEAEVLRWFCGIVGYPEGAGGFLTTGGSLANLSAVIAARQARLGEEPAGGVAYVSREGHHSLEKAASLAGIPGSRVRVLPVDELFRLRVDALFEAVQRDRAAGLRPFLVCGSAGTINTGAVDDLEALADAARELDLWMHVDAAYGGFFAMTERGAQAQRGLSRADSVTLDPHKGLFLPYGTGCLLVRDPSHLRDAHCVAADYLPKMQEESEFVDFCDISPELSRDFRGLRVWLPFRLHGAAAFRANLDEKLDLARWAAERLVELEDLEIVAQPQLSLLAFRLTPPGLDDERTDRVNQALLERVNARRRVYLTATRISERFVLRICVLSFRTHLDRVRECVEAIGEEARALLSGC